MPAVVRIELSGAPQGKGRGRAVSTPAGVRVYTPAQTVKYETQLRHAGTQAMGGNPPLDGPVYLDLIVRFPVPESWSGRKRRLALSGALLPTVKPDGDNVLKLIGDGLNEICWRDDKQLVDIRVRKRYAANPGITVRFAAVPMENEALDAPSLATRIDDSRDGLPLLAAR